MKALPCLVLLLASLNMVLPAEINVSKRIEDTVFCEPFTLKLHIDKEHFNEQKFDKMPFVQNSNVYLFKDEEFLDVRNDSIVTVKYQPDARMTIPRAGQF
jgi:hypothetical protein